MKFPWLRRLTRWSFSRGRPQPPGINSRNYVRPHCEFLEDRELPRGGGGIGHAFGGMVRLAANHKAPAHAGRPARAANPVLGQAVKAVPPAPTQVRPPTAAGKAVFSNHGQAANQFFIGNHVAANAAFRTQNDPFRFRVHHHDHLLPPYHRLRPFPWRYGRFPHYQIWWPGPHGGREFHHRDWGHGLHDGRDFDHRDWGHGFGDHEHHHLFHHLWLPVWWAPGLGFGRIGESRHDGWGHPRWEIQGRREERRPIVVNPLYRLLETQPIILEPRAWHGPVSRHDGWDGSRGDDWGRREGHESREGRIWRPPIIAFEHPLHFVNTWGVLHGWWGFHQWGWSAPHREEWAPGVPHWFLPPIIPIGYRLPEWFRREGRHGWGEFHRQGWWEPHRERWYLGSDHWRRPPVVVFPPPLSVVVQPLAAAEPTASADASLAVAEGADAGVAGVIAGGTAGVANVRARDGSTPPIGDGSTADSATAARDQFFAGGELGHAGGQAPPGGRDVLGMNDVFQGTPLAGDGLDLELPEWLRHRARPDGA